jgi:hypothetical protein
VHFIAIYLSFILTIKKSNMFHSLNFGLIPSEELYSFCKKTVLLVDEKKVAIPAVEPFLSNTKIRLGDFQLALDRDANNPLIKIRKQKTKNQLDAFMALRNLAESGSTRKKPGMAEAANIVLEIIGKYGWTTLKRTGQKARYTLLDGLITELKTKYADEVALIGATEVLDELEQAQAEYLEADTNVVRSENNKSEPTIGDTRKPLIDSIRQLFQIITLQEVAAPSTSVTALIASLNELITTSLATVKATHTRAENAKKSAGTTEVK